MPEDMSDRMPEDLPVRKCINAMAGIIRREINVDTIIYDKYFKIVRGLPLI
jgi:hypothetical protein